MPVRSSEARRIHSLHGQMWLGTPNEGQWAIAWETGSTLPLSLARQWRM
jgi:hypothetical protein